jgi:hypothetical protein
MQWTRTIEEISKGKIRFRSFLTDLEELC